MDPTLSNRIAAIVREDFSKIAGSADGIIHHDSQIVALLTAQLGREPTAADIERTANIFGGELNLARWTNWLNGNPVQTLSSLSGLRAPEIKEQAVAGELTLTDAEIQEEMPWGARPPVFPRPSLGSIENHAISVDQLARLGALVQRLCKSRMLRYPTNDYNTKLGRSDKPVSWTEITQYEINDQIIKKLIPEDTSCSWVELVAHREQLAEYFCSHFWGERMRELIASITAHSKASRKSHANHVPHYWICVYANNVRAPF